MSFNQLHLIVHQILTLWDFTNNLLQTILVIDATLASYNPSRFRKNLSETIAILIITIDDKIRDEKLQYDINGEAPKISVLWSGLIDKNEYLTGEKMLPSNQRQII